MVTGIRSESNCAINPMKNPLRHFLVAVSIFLLAACGTNRDDVSVQLTYIAVENGSATTSVAQSGPVGSNGLEAESDLSGATIRVSQDAELYGDKVGSVDFGQGTFVEGSLAITGSLRKPTRLRISVDARAPIDLHGIEITRTIGGEETEIESKSLMFLRPEPTTSLVVAPGDEIELALIDYIPEGRDRFVAVGNASNALNPWKRFTISGDLSSVAGDLTLPFIEVTGEEYDEQGKSVDIGFGSVMLKDGEFSLSGEVADPTVVTVSFYAGHCMVSAAKAIIEPNASLSVSVDDAMGHVVAASDEGKHSMLVDSWQLNEDFVALQKSFLRKLRELQDLGSGDSIDATFDDSESASVPHKQDVPITDSFRGQELVGLLQRGCRQSQIDADKIRSLVQADERYAGLFDLAARMSSVRDAVLRSALLDSENPIDGLLALELGAFANDSDGEAESLRIYDRLFATLDEDTLTRRVTPAYEEFKARHQSIKN